MITLKLIPWDHICVVIVFVLLSFGVHDISGADPTDLSRLRQDLLNGYDSHARPIQNHKNSTVVTFNPWLRGFEFDEERSIFTLFCWTIMFWYDDHMKWDPTHYGNLTRIHFGAWELWKPDLSVYNGLDQFSDNSFGYTRIIAYNTGRLIWVPPTRFQVGCLSNIKKWPYDTQTCHLIIGSWAHDGNNIEIEVPNNMTKLQGAEVVENREWKLVSSQAMRRNFTIQGIPYPDVFILLNLERRSATHTAAVVCPALAIATAILISFWLRPGAPERLALILLVILINAIYLDKIYTKLPNNGDNVPLVLTFYRDSLTMVSIALVWTICLRYLAVSKRTSPVPLPSFVTTFLESFPAKILCLDPRPVSGGGGTSNHVETDDEGKLVGNSNPHQADWAWLAHLLDRIGFLVYFIIYFCFYLAFL